MKGLNMKREQFGVYSILRVLPDREQK